MAVLLDTHALVWVVARDSDLSPAAEALIGEAAYDNALFVSAVSFWEIALLVSKQRLTLELPVQSWAAQVQAKPGLVIHPLTHDIAIASTMLPGRMHPDPADRFIVATARALDATLITRDQRLLAYGRHGHLDALPA